MTELEEIISGAEIAADTRGFNTRILYLTGYQHDALVLFEFATHLLDSFTTVPRGLASSPRKQSGKSTWLKSVVMLGWNAWKVDPTSFALRAKFNGRDKPLVMLDEISEYYGKNGLRAGPKDLNKILLEGYENDAQLSLSVDRSPMDVSSFCFAAMGGLRAAVRDDIWDRCIVWKMKPAPFGVNLEDALSDDIKADGKIHNARIHQWAMAHRDEVKLAFRDFRRPHRKMVARLRQIWGPLYAVALVLGEDWPERCVAAFKAMALDASEMPVLSGEQRVLRDVALLAREKKQFFTREIRDWLRSLPAEDDGDNYYTDLSDRGLALKITAALGAAQSMDIGSERARGYYAGPVLNAWARLEAKLNPPDTDDDEPDEYADFFEVTDITDSTDAVGSGNPDSRKRKEAQTGYAATRESGDTVSVPGYTRRKPVRKTGEAA